MGTQSPEKLGDETQYFIFIHMITFILGRCVILRSQTGCVIIVLEDHFVPFDVDLSPYRSISSLRKWLINE